MTPQAIDEKLAEQKKTVGVEATAVFDILIQLNRDIDRAVTPTEKLFVSEFVDRFLSLAVDERTVGFGDDPNREQIVSSLLTRSLKIRRQAVPVYDSRFLDKYIFIVNTSCCGAYKKSSALKLKDIKTDLLRIKKTLDKPELVGLMSDSEFQTAPQKVTFLLSKIKQASSRYHLYTARWFPVIENEIKNCIKQASLTFGKIC